MLLAELKELIKQGESRKLELKKSTGELKSGMHSACAFLNTEGGWLIFGVTPTSNKIIGQRVSDNTQREISEALSGLQPSVEINVEYIDLDDDSGNKLIAMYFDGWVWGERPHTYHGCPYYKVESTTKIMPQDLYDDRIRAYEPQAYSWERVAAEGISFYDLDENLIRKCIRRGIDGGRIPEGALYEPIKDILSKWKLLKNGVPTNGAALLFSKNIDEFPQFRLRMARFVGTNKNLFRDNQREEGNFFELLEAGMAFFFKHLSLSGRIVNTQLEREELLEIPYESLREALINALCHRWWELHNLTISIAIYDDRIEIASPGSFPRQITPQNIKEPHESYPHNLKVAEALYKCKYLENWGSGALRIMDVCKQHKVDEPLWYNENGFVTICFKRKLYKSTSSHPVLTHLSSSSHPPFDEMIYSNPQVLRLVDKMEDKYYTAKELADLSGYKDFKYFRRNCISPAIKVGVIKRLYEDILNHPSQKYTLTPEAILWKERIRNKIS